MKMNNIGLYLHIPFCASKCPYCDFYSFRSTKEQKEQYVKALKSSMNEYYDKLYCKADTLYLGGGTPSVLNSNQISDIINHAKSSFLTENAEITVECNSHGLTDEFFEEMYKCKVNRLSIGMQSANDRERKKLGRRGDRAAVESAVLRAKQAGIKNISLDVMLGIPDSTLESLKFTLDFCIEMNVPHISCYILKLEEGTPFFKMQDRLNLPDDDLTADMYLFMCEYLESHGIKQYEISNFAKPGYESRHNLKYWHNEEYLGLGASAHSFINGKRFYFPRDIDYFISGKEPVFDCVGGDFEEFSMLALRLSEGLTEKRVQSRFGFSIPEEMREKSEKFVKNGMLLSDTDGIRLTKQGFLLSNTIIAELI